MIWKQPGSRGVVEIRYLADNPQAIPSIAAWFFQEWPHRSADRSPKGYEEILARRLNRDRLPIALVALAGGKPTSTVSLKLHEVELRPQYENWLGSLYVSPDFRRQGIGSGLTQAAEEMAKTLGIGSLYLYTRHQSTEAYYARLGWRHLEELTYSGRAAVIMGKSWPA